MRASHPTLLALASVTAILAAPGLAQACEFYREAETRLRLFDTPETGNAFAITVLPAGASACILESRTDHAGNSWDRVDFYMLDNVKYNAIGWLEGGSADQASATAPGEAATASGSESTTAAAAPATTGGSKEAFFASNWTLAPDQSTLNFLSTKKGTVTETHHFNVLSGTISPDGTAQVVVDLESVDTGVDIRNVRMRFLFFRIDAYPTATITAHIDPASLSNLWEDRRVTTDLAATLDLHGETVDLVVPVNISRLGDGLVSVASVQPAMLNVAEFALEDGLAQLAAAVGNITISPIVPVTFDLTFAAATGG